MAPSGWSRQALADLAEYHNGRAFKPAEWSSVGLPIIRIAQMTDAAAPPNYYAGDDLDPRHRVDSGDLLFSWSATLSVMPWKRGPAAVNQHIFKVVERQGVNRSFLQHLLAHCIDALAEESHGSTMKHIRKGVLDTFTVLVPPLAEQRKIAAILSSVDETIEKTEAVIAQLDVVKKAMLEELLTRGIPGRHSRFKQTEIGEVPASWSVESFSELGAHITSGSRGWAQFYAPEGAPFLRITNVERGTTRLCLQELRFVLIPTGLAEAERTRLRADDILVSITAELGLVGLVPQGLDGFLNQHLALVRLATGRVAPSFAALALVSQKGQAQFQRLNDAGAKAGMNLGAVAALRIPIPAIEEQLRIVEVCAGVEERLAAEMEALSGLQSVKVGLAEELLAGRIRVECEGVG